MTTDYPALERQWAAAWPAALACWGPALRLAAPEFLTDASPPGLPSSFAWFDLDDVRATIDLRVVVALGLEADPVPVLAHEIGHHVLAPADATGRARVVERCRRGLGDRPDAANLMSNLWTDLLINDRLHRRHGLDLTAPYIASRRRADATAQPAKPATADAPDTTAHPAADTKAAAAAARPAEGGATDDGTRQQRRAPADYFDVYLRSYELLWSLPRGTLVSGAASEALEIDAGFLARHARVFARDAVGGAGGFAALMRRWLPDPEQTPPRPAPCQVRGHGSTAPDVGEDDSLAAPVRHPALDPRVNPQAPAGPPHEPEPGSADATTSTATTRGQGFGPSDLAALYSALDLTRDAATDWYAARARRHLVRFPVDHDQPASEPELQGLETWEIGDDLADIDWLGTATRSSTVLPGLTTQRRVVESADGDRPRDRPVDLDLYVDSSGSMPHPRQRVSPAVLGGAVLLLSALRVGASVRVTSWASPDQVTSSGDFSRDREAALAALLTFHGGGTSFPLAQLDATHRDRSFGAGPARRRCHIAVISDDGVSSLFGQGQPGVLSDAAHLALRRAGGGGTLVLQVNPAQASATRQQTGEYEVVQVESADDIVRFAREFAVRHWARSSHRTPTRRS